MEGPPRLVNAVAGADGVHVLPGPTPAPRSDPPGPSTGEPGPSQATGSIKDQILEVPWENPSLLTTAGTPESTPAAGEFKFWSWLGYHLQQDLYGCVLQIVAQWNCTLLTWCVLVGPHAGASLGSMPSSENVAFLGLPVFGTRAATLTAPKDGAALGAGAGNTSGTAPTPKGDSPPFTLGEGLPPIPAKLVAKILKGEYVDMAELLRDNMEAERRHTRSQSGETNNNGNTSARREIPDLLSWIQCFGMYTAVVASRSPERMQPMLAYQTMMVREARRRGGKGWLNYDTMFRQQAAITPFYDWSKLNNSLYSCTFMAQQNGRGHTCTLCLETDHVAADCALAPAIKQTRQSGREYTQDDRGYCVRGDKSEKICYSWNDGRCTIPYCRYRHVCAKCAGEHKAIYCSPYPPLKQGSQHQKKTGKKGLKERKCLVMTQRNGLSLRYNTDFNL